MKQTKAILTLIIMLFSYFIATANESMPMEKRIKNLPFVKYQGKNIIIDLGELNRINHAKNPLGFSSISTYDSRYNCKIIIDTDAMVAGATDYCIREAGAPFGVTIMWEEGGAWLLWGLQSSFDTFHNADPWLVEIFREAAECDPANSIRIEC